MGDLSRGGIPWSRDERLGPGRCGQVTSPGPRGGQKQSLVGSWLCCCLKAALV